MAKRKRGGQSRKAEPTSDIPVDPRDRQLYFAHRNRQRPERAEAIAGLVRVEFERRCQGPAWKQQLLAVLEEHAGPGLLSRVQGLETRRGELRLEVTEPAVRYELGLRWEQRLLALFKSRLPSAGITAVRFVAGR
jgi:hypothetical protein